MEPPRNVAGMIAPILHDAEVLPETASICCPATKGFVPCTTTLAQIGGPHGRGISAAGPASASLLCLFPRLLR